MPNPYIAGNAIGNLSCFVGRRDILNKILDNLQSDETDILFLYGQRRIGKSSILQRLAQELQQHDTIPIFYDLQDKSTLNLEDQLDELAKSIKGALKKAGIKGKKQNNSSDLPQILSQIPPRISITLLLDEFDVLLGYQVDPANQSFIPYLRELIQTHQKQIKAVLVMGLGIEDVNTRKFLAFRNFPRIKVSALTKDETRQLTILSQTEGSLYWSEPAIQHIWELTGGHSFLTQQLCWHVWEQVRENYPNEIPTVTSTDVASAVPETIAAMRQAIAWIWNGLPPSVKVIGAALAEMDHPIIKLTELENILQVNHIEANRIQDSLMLLSRWDLIEQKSGNYQFQVELQRLWIKKNCSLQRVFKDAQKDDANAEDCYRTGFSFYQQNRIKDAIKQLEQAIDIVVDHPEASVLLAQIYTNQEKHFESVRILESLYSYHQDIARPHLLEALFNQAQDEPNDTTAVNIYQQIEMIDSNQRIQIQKRIAGRIDRRIVQLESDNLKDQDQTLTKVVEISKTFERYLDRKHQKRLGNLHRRLTEAAMGGGEYQKGSSDWYDYGYAMVGRSREAKWKAKRKEIEQSRYLWFYIGSKFVLLKKSSLIFWLATIIITPLFLVWQINTRFAALQCLTFGVVALLCPILLFVTYLNFSELWNNSYDRSCGKILLVILLLSGIALDIWVVSYMARSFLANPNAWNFWGLP
jgi:tetratricopeptide (TPR) repeat protein